MLYDKAGDWHYDIISAFIKSMRGSDPDAALYWLARMLEGGEDPLFVARRLVILASEDVGLADPQALQVAVAAPSTRSAPSGLLPAVAAPLKDLRGRIAPVVLRRQPPLSPGSCCPRCWAPTPPRQNRRLVQTMAHRR